MAGQQESKMPSGTNVVLFDNYMNETRKNNIPIFEILNKNRGELIPITISFNTSRRSRR